MDYSHIKYELINNIAVITLNRPDVLNSFNLKMAEELQSALLESGNAQEVRVICIKGEGRAFSAGQDLADITSKIDRIELGEIVAAQYNPIIKLIRNIEKPVIGEVNGVAAGAGANIALACDIVVAAHSASFIQSFSKIGLIADSGGTYILPRLIGFPRAAAMLMLGEKISAEKALEIGMIYDVCEAEKLHSHVMEMAETLAKMPTRALGLIKKALNQSCLNALDEQLELEKQYQTIAGKTNDFQEGLRAFIEKRPPEFKGN